MAETVSKIILRTGIELNWTEINIIPSRTELELKLKLFREIKISLSHWMCDCSI